MLSLALLCLWPRECEAMVKGTEVTIKISSPSYRKVLYSLVLAIRVIRQEDSPEKGLLLILAGKDELESWTDEDLDP